MMNVSDSNTGFGALILLLRMISQEEEALMFDLVFNVFVVVLTKLLKS